MTVADITNDLFRRLQHRYSGHGGTILLTEVGNGAGYGNTGRSDAIAMQTWPSKGLELTGFEVKATKQDWQRELDKPHKNKEWQECCHQWFIVAPKDVIPLVEIPKAWGLMVPMGKDGLRIAVRCEREPPTDSKRVSLDLVAAVFRAVESERAGGVQRKTAEIREAVRGEYQSRIDDYVKCVSASDARYKKLIDAIGGKVWHDFEQLKARAKLLESLDVAHAGTEVDNMIDRLEFTLRKLQEAKTGIEWIDKEQEEQGGPNRW